MENKGKKILIGCGTIIGGGVILIVILIVVIGIAIENGLLPDSEALPKGKIHPRYIKELRALGVIEPDEDVQYFYSSAMFSIKVEGNLFTDKRAISYQKKEGQLELHSARYEDIRSIDFYKSESWENDSKITVTRNDGTWFILFVSTDAHGDEIFYKKLHENWLEHHNKSREKPEEPGSRLDLGQFVQIT